MRTLPSTLAARLAVGSTQMAYAWIVRRRDGTVMGFTDHDSDLVVNGVACRAATGLAAKDMTSELGMAAGGGEVVGALQAASLREEDIVGGAYDGADIEIFLCDCEAPFENVRLDAAIMGEIKRDETAFVAELRGPAQRLGEEIGRLYHQRCDADFGDSKCGMDLIRADLSVRGTIAAVIMPGRYQVNLVGATPGTLTNGALQFDKWPDRRFGIRQQTQRGARLFIDLWSSPEAVQVNDAILARVGCDKSFATCSQRFGNAINFRGFPHMPGNEIVLTLVQDGAPGYDGRSLFHG